MTTLIDIRPSLQRMRELGLAGAAAGADLRARLKDAAGFSRLLARVIAGIDELSDGINAGLLSPTQWHNELANLLLVGHTAAYQEGRGITDLPPGARRLISQLVGEQVDFLNRFLDQVEARGWDDRRDRARAALYAGALKATYSRGVTFGLELPAYPGDGSSECLGNCGCQWRVDWIDQEELDADCYWVLGGAERHCRTCPQRAAAWAPLRLRGGRPA